MTPLERAARAIAAIDYRKGVRDCERPSEPPVYTPIAWDSLSAKAQIESAEKARAVLEAIREPSWPMLEAVGFNEGKQIVTYERDADTWRAMIDAALKEG